MPDARRPRVPRSSWSLPVLVLVAAGVIALAAFEVGPPSSSARTSRAVLTAARGIVQSTVTGTGNVEAGTDVSVNFQTSGTLAEVYVSAGQHVTEGQLLASLDPTSAQLSLEQAQESLNAAEDQLTAVENGTASPSSGTSASLRATSTGTTAFVADTTTTTAAPAKPRPKPKPKLKPKPRTMPKPRTRTTTTATPAPQTTSTTPARTTSTTTTPSPASIASAQASVLGAEANVQSAKTALAKTRLYAPTSGTIVSLASLTAGDSVSSGSTSSSSGTGSSSSTSSSSSSGSGSGASTTAGALGGSGSSSSSGTGSSSAFAEIVDSGTMTMTVAFSESDISKIKVGQAATITMEALSGVELGAHVTAISPVATTSSSVVSYDATLTLDQRDRRVKPGMSASAAVITGQAQGVTVPNEAVTGTGSIGSVNVLEGGKMVSRQVVVGLRGDSRTQIVSGLTAGQQLVVTITLPSLGSSSTGTGASGASGTLGGSGLSGTGPPGGFGAAGFRAPRGAGGFGGGAVP